MFGDKESNFDVYQIEELEELVATVRQVYNTDSLWEVLLPVGIDFTKEVEHASFNKQVLLLIRKAFDLGVLHHLVDVLDKNRNNHPVLQDYRARATPPLLPPGVAPSGGPSAAAPAAGGHGGGPSVEEIDAAFKIVLLNTDRPFLDRSNLRRQCKLLTLGNSRRILHVSGAKGVGKTYTSDFLAGVRATIGAANAPFRSEVIDLGRLLIGSGDKEVSGRELAERLSIAITGSGIPETLAASIGSEQDPTWAAAVIYRIMKQATRDPIRWVFLDGFDGNPLSKSGQAVVTALLERVKTDGEKVRVGLLGYEGNVSWVGGMLKPITLENHELVGEVALRQHARQYLELVRDAAVERGRNRLPDEALTAAISDALEPVDFDAPDLHDLGDSLTEIAEEILVGVR